MEFALLRIEARPLPPLSNESLSAIQIACKQIHAEISAALNPVRKISFQELCQRVDKIPHEAGAGKLLTLRNPLPLLFGEDTPIVMFLEVLIKGAFLVGGTYMGKLLWRLAKRKFQDWSPRDHNRRRRPGRDNGLLPRSAEPVRTIRSKQRDQKHDKRALASFVHKITRNIQHLSSISLGQSVPEVAEVGQLKLSKRFDGNNETKSTAKEHWRLFSMKLRKRYNASRRIHLDRAFLRWLKEEEIKLEKRSTATKVKSNQER